MKHLLAGFFLLLFIQAPLTLHAFEIDSAEMLAEEQKKEGNLGLRSNSLKSQIIELNRDLFLLKEDLLHPASTRLVVYVSMDFDSFFKLDAIKVKLDGKLLTSFLYTNKDIAALRRGAIQPLYQGNIISGPHELVVFFTGIGSHQREFKRAVSIKFEKEAGEQSFEIQIKDEPGRLQPQFVIKPWNS